MSDIAFDRGVFFPSPLQGWHRERPFKLALAGSLLVHAALLAFVPGFRSVPPELPKVLDVQIVPEEQPVQAPVRKQPVPEQKREVAPPRPVVEQPRPVVEPPKPIVEPPKPIVEPPKPVVEAPRPVVEPPRPVVETPTKPVEPKPEVRKVEPRPEPRPVEPEPVRQPEPVARAPEPVAPPPPRTEVLQTAPRPEQKPEQFAMPRPDPQPAPQNVQPRVEARAEAPVPRAAPAQQQPAPVAPRVEAVVPPAVTPPPTAVAPPPSQVAVQPPPAPSAPVQKSEPVAERSLVATYEKSLSDLIKRHENYPPRARREGWEGTAVVGLSLSADGKVMDIRLLETSGREVLDQAALEMVRRASPLPRAPEGLRGKERVVRVPIAFKLHS